MRRLQLPTASKSRTSPGSSAFSTSAATSVFFWSGRGGGGVGFISCRVLVPPVRRLGQPLPSLSVRCATSSLAAGFRFFSFFGVFRLYGMVWCLLVAAPWRQE